MIINRSYIVQRTKQFIEEQQKNNQQQRNEADKLYQIKMKFPKWLRTAIFHPFNPVYSVYLQHKAFKKKDVNNIIKIPVLHRFATDYLYYFIDNECEFDTDLYYPKQDESEIARFIDNRIKSVISCANIPIKEEQKEMFRKRQELTNSAKKTNNGYILSLDNENYYLPVNSFNEHTYIHEYGLKYLPQEVKAYIAGKDFLDVGSFLGDTAILLQKKYKPKHIYAYEPVNANFEQLNKTIQGNALQSEISIVQKGLGDQDAEIDIYINPLELSASSINENITTNEGLIKETIQITTLDKECMNKTVGLIKMDIEGAEYSAIKGALETIKRDKPVINNIVIPHGKRLFRDSANAKKCCSGIPIPIYQYRNNLILSLKKYL